MISILAKILLLSTLILSVSNAQEYIKAMKVPGDISIIGPKSKAWLSAQYSDVVLYPHTVNKPSNFENLKPKKAKVKALYNEKNIAFLIKWKDSTHNAQLECCSKKRLDGFALQLPTVYDQPSKLPYISMGSKERPVVVHLQKAFSKKENLEDNATSHLEVFKEYHDTFHEPIENNKKLNVGRFFLTEGSKKIMISEEESKASSMQIVYKNNIYKGTLSRTLETKNISLKQGVFPVSFVIWDGSEDNIDGIEFISSWIGVRLLGQRGGDELLNALNGTVEGDIENGKRLAMENCAGCHNFARSSMSPDAMAPNLTNVAGYSVVEYLKESMLEPSAVIVPNYKANAHPNLPWYNENEDGSFSSTMPSYYWMDQKSIDDIISFFIHLAQK